MPLKKVNNPNLVRHRARHLLMDRLHLRRRRRRSNL